MGSCGLGLTWGCRALGESCSPSGLDRMESRRSRVRVVRVVDTPGRVSSLHQVQVHVLDSMAQRPAKHR